MKQTFQIAILFILTMSSQAALACQGAIGGKEGFCARDFKLPNLSGSPVQLSSYRGKIVILNFWATWCEPCVIEIPVLDRLNQTLPKDKIVMLTINIDDEGKMAVDKFFKGPLKGKTPTFPVLLDPEQKISKSYGTFKFPETYIIDKTGRIRDKVEGIRDWDDSMILHYVQLLGKE